MEMTTKKNDYAHGAEMCKHAIQQNIRQIDTRNHCYQNN